MRAKICILKIACRIGLIENCSRNWMMTPEVREETERYISRRVLETIPGRQGLVWVDLQSPLIGHNRLLPTVSNSPS